MSESGLSEGLLAGSPARSHTLQIESPRSLARQYSTGAKVQAMIFATLNVSIAATGTGFLSFPFAFQQAGYVLGTALCVGTSVLCAYSLTIIASCARQHNASSYQELVKIMFGEWARQCVQWIVILFNYTGNIASLQVISSQAAPLLAVWFPQQLAGSSPSVMQCNASVPEDIDLDGSDSGAMQSNHLCVASTMAAATILVTPLCLMRSIESLGPTSTLGACCVLFTSVVVAMTGINEPEINPEFAWKPVQLRLTAFQAVPIVCFATMCHFTVVPATAALRPYFEKHSSPLVSSSSSLQYQSEGSDFPAPLGWKDIKVLVLLCCCVMLWCNFLYVPVGVLGYRAFGSQSSSNILDNFGLHSKSDHFVDESVAVLVARACMCTTTCLSYPIFTFITRMAIVDVLYGGTDDGPSSRSQSIRMEGRSLASQLSTLKHVTITILFLVFCAVSGIAVVWVDISLGFTVSVIGATVVVAVEFFLPAAMCWQTHRRISAVIFGVLGATVLVLGLFVTVADEACGESTAPFCVACIVQADALQASFGTLLWLAQCTISFAWSLWLWFTESFCCQRLGPTPSANGTQVDSQYTLATR